MFVNRAQHCFRFISASSAAVGRTHADSRYQKCPPTHPLCSFHVKQADAWLRPLPCPLWRDACCAGGEDGLLQRSCRACPLHISHTHHLSIIRPRPLGTHVHARMHTRTRSALTGLLGKKVSVKNLTNVCAPQSGASHIQLNPNSHFPPTPSFHYLVFISRRSLPLFVLLAIQ